MNLNTVLAAVLLLITPFAHAAYPDYNWNNFGHGATFQMTFNQDVLAVSERNSNPLIRIPVDHKGWFNLDSCFIEIISSAETVTIPAGASYKVVYNDESGWFDVMIPDHKSTLFCNARIMVKTVKAGMNKIGMDIDLPVTREIRVQQNEVLPK